jgi:hypothetical protein
MVTLQMLMPEQAPAHPENVWSERAAAVSSRMVPKGKLALHIPLVAPLSIKQSMPAGVDSTFPLPDPSRVMVRAWSAGWVKVALTRCAWSMEISQAPLPVQAPLHPAKV